MTEPQVERDPLDVLADDFAAKCRRGESPSIAQYADEHPSHAERIRELFPAIAMMERFRSAKDSQHKSSPRRAAWSPVPDDLGDFRVIREIGRGGMGIVFEAEQRSLKRRVAIKVLPKHALLREQDLRRFRREAQIAANLHHTNIVPVFGAGEHDGLHFYVMPLIRGVGLDVVIRESRGIERPNSQRWKFVSEVGIQAAQALAFAHAHGTLHRDVKPSNLLVEDDGTVCVADFGLARAMDHLDASHSGDCLGTLRYMAPEQFDGRADHRSDIYSLGLTLYELATLQAAFQDTRRRAAIRGGATGTPPARPAKLTPEMPRDLETIILKCIAESPQHRYQTADELSADLRRFADDRPIHARRVGWLERAYRWSRRNPALAATSSLAVVLLAAVAVTLSISYLETRQAHVETVAALDKAEAHSELALDVLEGIYQQLSSERVGVCTETDADGEVCACTQLGPHGDSSSAVDRSVVHVYTSQQTVMILENLLVFYDRLADQVSGDRQVLLESAIACRRVGDIHQRLGQLDLAEKDYLRAIDKLQAIRPDAPLESSLELAKNYNEIGNVHFAQEQNETACVSHHRAVSILTATPSAQLPESHRYELARTYYYLANRVPGVTARPLTRNATGSTSSPLLSTYRRSDYRQQAAGLLEGLIQEHPETPDYQFLLALCRRPLRPVTESSRDRAARDDAIRILRQLVADHPEAPEYRFELATTYAWVHVGLYPWQARSGAAESIRPDLQRAVDELQWLVDHSPAVPHYARSLALTLAKLGTIYWTEDRLDDAARLFEQAYDTQAATVAYFPSLPRQNHVQREFYRLRAAQLRWRAISRTGGTDRPQDLIDQLDGCVENLTELIKDPDLAQDRLAQISLREACSTLAAATAKQ